jgi:hypothetical protein
VAKYNRLLEIENLIWCRYTDFNTDDTDNTDTN